MEYGSSICFDYSTSSTELSEIVFLRFLASNNKSPQRNKTNLALQQTRETILFKAVVDSYFC